MGLDSYVYRISKPNIDINRVYSEGDLNEMLNVYNFPKSDADDDCISEIIPYCEIVKVEVERYDWRAICTEYGLGNGAYVSSILPFGGIVVRFGDKSVSIDGDLVKTKFTKRTIEDCYVYRSEEVMYWRKEYDVQSFMYDNIESADNVTFCLLDEDVVKEFNNTFGPNGDNRWQLPEEENTDEHALFYYEWY